MNLFLRPLLLWMAFFWGSIVPGAKAQSDTLKVVTWNLEWWADGSANNANTQVAKTQQLLQQIDADFYGFQEIVNVDSFQQMVGRLNGGPWASLVADWGSSAPNAQSSYYASAQKIAFLYKPALFRNVRMRAFLKAHPYSYYDFASGRYPMLVSGELACRDGSWQEIHFVVLHAKAMTDDRSCNRRVEGAEIMKDTLDGSFAGSWVLMLGDFNDDLDTSICNSTLVSNYANFVSDSVVIPFYKSITLPISRAGTRSSDQYPSLIDHFIANNQFSPLYVPGSAQSLRTLANATVSQYSSTVSDHYPVQMKMVKPFSALSVTAPVVSNTTPAMPAIGPIPCQELLRVERTDLYKSYRIYDVSGRILLEGALAPAGTAIATGGLPAGMYFLSCYGKEGTSSRGRFVKE